MRPYNYRKKLLTRNHGWRTNKEGPLLYFTILPGLDGFQASGPLLSVFINLQGLGEPPGSEYADPDIIGLLIYQVHTLARSMPLSQSTSSLTDYSGHKLASTEVVFKSGNTKDSKLYKAIRIFILQYHRSKS